MSKTVFEVGEVIAGAALIILTAGAAAPAVAWGMSTSMAASLFSIGVGAGITGVFGLLQPLLNPQDTSVPGSQANAQESVAFRRVIYGVMEVGGVLTFDEMPAGSGPFQNVPDPAGNYGLQNWRHQVYTVSGTEITSFGRGGIPMVVIDDIATELMLDPAGSGYYVPVDSFNPYSGVDVDAGYSRIYHIAFEFDTGSPTSPSAFTKLGQACPDWNANCIQQGRAKVHVAMRYDVNADGSQVSNSHLWTQVPIYVSGRVPTFRFPLVGKPLSDTRGISTLYPTVGTSMGAGWEEVTPVSGTGVASNTEEIAGTAYWSGFPAAPAGITGLTLNIGLATFEYGRGFGDFIVSYSLDGGVTYALVGSPGTGTHASATYSVTLSPTQDLTLVWVSAFVRWTGAPPDDYGTVDMSISNIWAQADMGGATSGPSNPALCIYDFLTNSEYGMDADPSTIDIDSINAAANICEEQVTVYIASNGLPVTEQLYSCNGLFDQSATRGDILKALLSSMAGTVVPPGDQWHVFAGTYNPPTVTLTDADLRGPIKGDFRISRRDICNGVKGTFIPEFLPTNTTEQQPTAWRWTDFPPYQGSGLQGHPDYITEDGGQIIWKEVRFGFTTSLWMVQRLAKIALQLLRFQVTLHLACKLTAFRIQAGDTITFVHARWASLPTPPPTIYFVTQAVLMVEMTDGVPAFGMDLVLRETDPSVYTFAAPTSFADQGEYSQYGTLGTY